MQTAATFNDVMSGLTEALYTRAQEDLERRRLSPLDSLDGRTPVRSQVEFAMVVGPDGKATTSVNRYCAGHTLSCSATFESPNPHTRFSGSFASDEGGGINFALQLTHQPLRFELSTSFWHRTQLSVSLNAVPALPPGTVLKVKLDVEY
jgi:hypothetical protein